MASRVTQQRMIRGQESVALMFRRSAPTTRPEDKRVIPKKGKYTSRAKRRRGKPKRFVASHTVRLWLRASRNVMAIKTVQNGSPSRSMKTDSGMMSTIVQISMS